MTKKVLLQRLESDAERYRHDREHVADLAARHNADLPNWCARRRWHHRLVTDAVIAVSIAAFVVITVLPNTDGHYISNAQTRTETLHTIDETLLASL